MFSFVITQNFEFNSVITIAMRKTRTKLRKSFKGILNCCKLQIVFKSQRKLVNKFRFKDRLPFELMSGVVHKQTCGRCNSSNHGEADREHIGISTLREYAIRDYLLICNNILSFDEFTILAYGYHKYILEIKESLLIKGDRPILNKNISSGKLFFFRTLNNNQNFKRFYYMITLFCYVI